MTPLSHMTNGSSLYLEETLSMELHDPLTCVSPNEFLRCLLPQECHLEEANNGFSLDKRIPMDGYNMEVVNAIRSNDIAALRFMLENGQNFNVCNANGEYLIHLASRRSSPDTVLFLIDECNVNLDVRDTTGRSILHDICWKSSHDEEMMVTVLRRAPMHLLLSKDIRGHTPFDFARKHHWKQWLAFLKEHRDIIREKA